MIVKLLRLILRSLRYRSLRSWLTILGVIIGIMLVIIIMSLSSGIRFIITKNLQMFGSNVIIVMPGKDNNPLLGLVGGQRFRERDLMDLERINGVSFVVPMENKIMNVEYKGEKKSAMIHAANWKNYIKVLESSQGLKLAKGLWPADDKVKNVVLGYKAASDLFRERVIVGSDLIIKSKRFTVSGSLTEIGEQMLDNVLFISGDLYRELTGLKSGAASAFVRLDPGANVNLVAKKIKFRLSKQDVVRDFTVLTPEKAGRLADNILGIVEMVLLVIAIISLLVGAVGITNTMYTSVLERTKQIGIMKSIGATDEVILSLFLVESGLIGFIGGAIGIIFGIFAAYMISIVAAEAGIRGLFSFASLDFLGFFIILLFTFVVGIVAGILPAKQAAKLEPAEALRYE